MDNGPAVLMGVFFAACATFCVVAPWLWLWKERRFAARAARVGAHVTDLHVEETRTGRETIRELHATVAFVTEDGREVVASLQLPERVEPGAELWLLHDREAPERVSVEPRPGGSRRAAFSSVLGIVLLGGLAYVMLQIGGVVPEVVPLE